YAQQPFSAPVPGIGGATDTADDPILKYAATFDFTFALALSSKLTIGLDVGYGKRGRYSLDPSAAVPSTGMMSLRPLDDIDPSQSSTYAPNNLAQQHA